jgi:hypothetical protein
MQRHGKLTFNTIFWSPKFKEGDLMEPTHKLIEKKRKCLKLIYDAQSKVKLGSLMKTTNKLAIS